MESVTMSEAVDIMRGAIGTPLKLTIQRKGEEAKNLTLIRSKIEVGSVKTRQIAPDYTVVRISQFQTHTGRDLTNALIKLKETQPTLKGIILDLRNNPGGVLGGAISVADAFIDKGLVVYTKARTEESWKNSDSGKSTDFVSGEQFNAGSSIDHGTRTNLGR